MILNDLMTKGFLTKDIQGSTKNSNYSNYSNYNFSATNKKGPSSSSLKSESVKAPPAIVAIVAIDGLPTECPFNTGGPCPPGCRFETKLFLRMIREGVLPTDGGCPLLSVCNLARPLA